MRIDKDNIKIILILLVVCLGIGYSYLNTELNINGTANINNVNWDVHWDHLQVTNWSVSGSNVITPATIQNPTTLTFSVTLTQPGLSCAITNQGVFNSYTFHIITIFPTHKLYQKNVYYSIKEKELTFFLY